MQDIPVAEAEALLAVPRTCVDCEEWVPVKGQPETVVASSGLIDPDGSSSGLYVELQYALSAKTKIRRYRFTVFRFTHGSPGRIYQLQVDQWKKPPSAHHLSHDHMGRERTIGDPAWNTWTFEEVLAYFCQRANITFVPPTPHPEAFELK